MSRLTFQALCPVHGHVGPVRESRHEALEDVDEHRKTCDGEPADG